MNSTLPPELEALAEELLSSGHAKQRSPEEILLRYERATQLSRQIADVCLSSDTEAAEKLLGLATAVAVLSAAMSRPDTRELLLHSLFSYARNVLGTLKDSEVLG